MGRGKRKLTRILIDAFPADFDPLVNRFYEPFVGGGALSFALGNPDSDLFVPGRNLYINDMNPDLINTYKIIRDDLGSLIKELRKFEKLNDSDSFYRIRATEFENEVKSAARFIYLNKTCFNGLWRVNSNGAFNVPYGGYKNPNILDVKNLELCSDRLKNSKITFKSYSKAITSARKGDLIYFDPPYIPISKTATFSQYAKDDFSLGNQKELAEVIHELSRRGVKIILSNSDTDLTREIFGKDLHLKQILVARTISAQVNTRKSVHEVIGTNYTLKQSSELSKYKSIR